MSTAPPEAFGAIYAKATNNWIGAVEMITATAWCGIVYSLIGGQPMMINGGTGPVLAFTEIIYKMSESLDVPFISKSPSFLGDLCVLSELKSVRQLMLSFKILYTLQPSTAGK